MKYLLLHTASAALFCLSITISLAQPAIQWEKSFGGSNMEETKDIVPTNDGGYIMVGFTGSNDGNVTGNHGSVDIWVVKTNNIGAIEWKKCYGGSDAEYGNSIYQTTDGGYIIAGTSSSSDGDRLGYNHGSIDIWVIKIDSYGTIQWQRGYGGTNDEFAYDIIQTTDGGYIVAGQTSSWNGDVSGNQTLATTSWILKLNVDGSIKWNKCLIIAAEHAYSIQQTGDGGYVFAGSGGAIQNGNYSIVKTDTSGNIQWQKSFGGTSVEVAYSVQLTNDGGYIVAGYTSSNDGDVTEHHGTIYTNDAWVVKLDNSGGILWKKCFGGTDNDVANSIQQTLDGGYIIAGYSYSNDGDALGNHGGKDYWIVKTDYSGNILWQKSMGGTNDEEAFSIYQTTDGGFIITGTSNSSDGDVTGNIGSGDYWTVKLSAVIYQNSFFGNVFNDVNNNGIKDSSETGLTNVLLETQGNHYIYNTNSSGNFIAYSLFPSDTLLCIKNSIYSTTTPLYYPVTASDSGKNFAIHYFPDVKDLRITLINLTPARRGSDDKIRITFENIGTDTLSGLVSLDFKNILNFQYSLPAQFSLIGSTLTWNYSNLNPLEKRNIDVWFNVPPSVPIGAVLVFTGKVYPVIGDTFPSNNMCSIEQVAIGSWDPNSKEVIPDSGYTDQQMANAEDIYYTIHFQNTGTDTAINAKILDTLSSNLDISTFEMLSTSHPCDLNIQGPGIVEFTFNNILLPDSNVNFTGSNGFVKYAVKPKSSLIVGDSITNTSYIYFDYNEPVQTNTTSTLLLQCTLSSAIIPNSSTTFCQGDSVVLSAKKRYGYTYKWQISGADIFGAIDSFLIVKQAGDYTLVIDSSNCSAFSSALTITVNPVPVPVISGINYVCEGATGNIYTTGTGMNGYVWNVSSGGAITYGQGMDTISVSWNAPGMQTVDVTYSDTNGCIPSSPSILNIAVNPLPNANAGTDQTICPGTSVTLTASGGNSYTWNNGVTQGVPFTPTATNTYTVTVSNGLCTSSDSIIVTITTPPATPAIYQVGNVLYSTATSGNQWYNTSGAISGATGSSYSPTISDNYYVIVTDTNGCVSDTSNILSVIVGIEELSYSSGINIYPNPANTFLSIELAPAGAQNLVPSQTSRCKVYDILGSLLIEKTFTGTKTRIDVRSLAKGLYLLKVESEEGVAVRRFVKE